MLEGDPDADARKIRRFLEPEENAKLCRNARRRFERVVNFEKEAKAVKKFLDRLR